MTLPKPDDQARDLRTMQEACGTSRATVHPRGNHMTDLDITVQLDRIHIHLEDLRLPLLTMYHLARTQQHPQLSRNLTSLSEALEHIQSAMRRIHDTCLNIREEG